MNHAVRAGLEVPACLTAPLCRLLGCTADGLPDALADLDDDGAGWLRHDSGARLYLVLALPWHGPTWRVARIVRPVPAPVEALTPRPSLLAGLTYRTILELAR